MLWARDSLSSIGPFSLGLGIPEAPHRGLLNRSEGWQETRPPFLPLSCHAVTDQMCIMMYEVQGQEEESRHLRDPGSTSAPSHPNALLALPTSICPRILVLLLPGGWNHLPMAAPLAPPTKLHHCFIYFEIYSPSHQPVPSLSPSLSLFPSLISSQPCLSRPLLSPLSLLPSPLYS